MKRVIYGLIIVLSIFISTNSINAYTEYKIGDKVTYNDIDFYVIKDSSSKEDNVTMLKVEPLTLEELQKYSNGLNVGINEYGEMMYHENSSEYSTSYIKIVVDAWAQDKVASGLKDARLITYDDLQNSLGYNHGGAQASWINLNPEYTPSWVYNSNYSYWTMTPHEDSKNRVWYIAYDGRLRGGISVSGSFSVRPVITLSKTVLGDIDESIIDNDSNEDINGDTEKESNVEDNKSNNINTVDNIKSKNVSSTKVKVDNTYMGQSLIIIMLGFIISCASVVSYYIIRKKEGK